MYNCIYNSYKVRDTYVGCFCMLARPETGYQKHIKSTLKYYILIFDIIRSRAVILVLNLPKSLRLYNKTSFIKFR